MVLPIWLWLVICIVIFVVAAVAWLRKTARSDPRSARAAASGNVIADAKLDGSCRSAVAQHEVTAPGQTSFVALLAPLEFASSRVRVRTPISLALSDRTLGVTYKQGALGNVATMLIDRRDITTGHATSGSAFSYTIESSRAGTVTVRLQTEADRQKLQTWVAAVAEHH